LASGASDSYGVSNSEPIQAPSDYRQERSSFLTDLIGNSIDDVVDEGNIQYSIRAPEAYVINGKPVTPSLVVDVASKYEPEDNESLSQTSESTTVAPGYIIIEEESDDFQETTTPDYYASTTTEYGSYYYDETTTEQPRTETPLIERDLYGELRIIV
jgi:hypothetical protein